MAATNKTSAGLARRLGKQSQALELRRMGKGYQEIAEALGIGKTHAHRLVKQALQDARDQVSTEALELRAEELSRLDAMLASIWVAARRGELAAVDRVLRIMERRAKLLGLDAPIKHAATDPTGEEERERPIWVVPPELPIDQWHAAAQAISKH